jgi:hypothetical protein
MIPRDAFWGIDPGARFLQVINFSIQDQSLTYPAQWLDPSRGFVPFHPLFAFEHTGKIYGVYNPLFIAISSLFYHFFGFEGLYIVPLLSSFAVLILTTLLVQEVAPGWQVLVPPVIGLGSPLLFYALTFWEHTLGTALATGSVLLCYQNNQYHNSWGSLFVTGVLAGLGFIFRPELGAWCLAMLLSALLIWSGHRVRMFIAFSTGVLLIAGLLQLYEWITFGALVRRHITNNYGAFFLQETWAWFNRQISFMTTMFFPGHQRTLWQVLWSSLLILVLLFTVTRNPVTQTIIRIFVVLLSLVMGGLLLITINTQMVLDDIIQTFPLICFTALALVIPRTPVAVGTSNLLRFLLGTVAIFVVLVLLTTFNSAAGGQWGPRYLLAIMPAITVIIFGCLGRMHGTINRFLLVPSILLLIILLLLSFVMQYQSVQQLHTQKVMQQEMISEVASLSERIIVVDRPGTALVLAPVFQSRLLLLVSDQQEAEAFVQILRAHDIINFAYVSLAVIDDNIYQVPLDFKKVGSCYFGLQDQTYSLYQRSLFQVAVNVHFVVQRYKIEECYATSHHKSFAF